MFYLVGKIEKNNDENEMEEEQFRLVNRINSIHQKLIIMI